MMFLITLLFVPFADGAITDLSCTMYNGTAHVYSPGATSCANQIADSSCQSLYPASGDAYPAPGNDAARPLNCYTTVSSGPIISDMKTNAIAHCAKTCGYCCISDAFSCRNAAMPRLNCATITPNQCKNPVWRKIIIEDCPASCGLCNVSGCVDTVPYCANDVSICKTVGLEDFVNRFCKRTCGKC